MLTWDLKPGERLLRVGFVDADGVMRENVTGLVDEADRQRSVEQFCLQFMYPALSQLGWRWNTGKKADG